MTELLLENIPTSDTISKIKSLNSLKIAAINTLLQNQTFSIDIKNCNVEGCQGKFYGDRNFCTAHHRQ